MNSSRIRRTTRTLAVLAGIAALALASCSGSSEASEEEPTKDPTRIVALSPDASIALHQLGATDRLVAVPESATNPTLNPYAVQMADVPNTLAGDNDPEPEEVLGHDPDLVVVTSRHGGEKDAARTMEKSGVQVLTLDNGWSTTDDVVANLKAIGDATGTQDEAEELAKRITDGVGEVRASAEEATSTGDTPSVAILSNQGRVPFINTGSSLVSDLVDIAGGSDAAGKAGIKKTQPVQPEQLVTMKPDKIMLVDVTGKGRSSFDALLKNPAVADLPAVKEGHVKMYKGREVYALAGIEVVKASEDLLTWLHPETDE